MIVRLAIVSACLSVALATPAMADTSGSGTGFGQPPPPGGIDNSQIYPPGGGDHEQHNPGSVPGAGPDKERCTQGKADGLANFIGQVLPPPFKGLCQHFVNFALTDHTKHDVGIGDSPTAGNPQMTHPHQQPMRKKP